MIRLVSDPTEQALARLNRCEAQAREAQEAGRPLTDSVERCYRHVDVKSAILRETAEKCAYCESKVTHVYWGDVEHLKPRRRFPEYQFNYNNLTLACAVCNNKKGDYWLEEAPIVDPYVEEPADHLLGLGPLLWHRNGSPTGQRTIDLLDLNRERLRERRLECLERLSALVDRYQGEPPGPVKDSIERQLREEIAATAEFALVARWFLRSTCGIQLGAV